MTGEELRAVRLTLGMTQTQFADRIGMHSNTVARMERNEKPITTRTAAVVQWMAKLTSRKKPPAKTRQRS